MSKVTDAKASQGYLDKSPCCGDCCNMTSEQALPAWMIRHNEELQAKLDDGGKKESWDKHYTVERYGVEKSIRCGVGRFKVKKGGYCQLFMPKK